MRIIKIAVYGKGGIGKSTISANISAALAQKNKKILQIGCDPKHDSTRLLLGGKLPKTVLDYIKEVIPENRKLGDIVFSGYGNTACVEAGGPEPGVGCAGRGIITTFELLDTLGLNSFDFDYVIYDVLGDVVCGGFAVPIRKEYADAIYIVTSGEFMALYAANNILRGIKNFGDSPKRVAGIIHNSRGLKDEDERVCAFADAVKLPVVAEIPRSNIFASAEKEGKTLIEAFPDSSEAVIFKNISGNILSLENNYKNGIFHGLYGAFPLDDNTLESVILGTKNEKVPDSFKFCEQKENECEEFSLLVSERVKTKHPLQGCAFAGAACITTQIEDSYTLLHCPKSCAHMIYGIIENSLLRMHRLYDYTTDFDITKRLGTTNICDDDFIFGGNDKLRNELEKTVLNNHKFIFIITACPPGIIGDDVQAIASDIMKKNPDVRIECVLVDGNLQGDFSQGYISAFETITGFIEKNNQKIENSVNIIGEKSLATNEEYDLSSIKSLLEMIGVSVNCRFITRTDINSIKNLNTACLNLPAHDDHSSRMLAKLISQRSDLPILDMPFPTGFTDTSKWLLEVSKVFGKTSEATKIIETEKKIYKTKINELRPKISGKRLLISSYSRNIDWIIELAYDLEMEIVRIGLMYSPSNEPLRTKYKDLPIREGYNSKIRGEEIRLFLPDLVLIDRPVLSSDDYVRNATIPYSPGFGFRAGLVWAEMWCRLMRLPLVEGWKSDRIDIL